MANRHMFAGVSTPKGFINYFDHIMPLGNAVKRYYLKGSSGSGKSMFIKKIAAAFQSNGFCTELFHCANDIESLDAMAVKEKGVCIIDATAPHSRDPEIPAAIDEIIDFATFIDESKLFKHKEKLQSLIAQKRVLYERANGYFSAAGKIYLSERNAYESALLNQSVQKLTRGWFKIFDGHAISEKPGTDRKLFLNAVTPDGLVGFADVLTDCKIYTLRSETGAGTDTFLTALRDEANLRGICTESFYNPLAPNKMEYLNLPKIKTAFAVDGEYEKIDFSNCFDKKLLRVIKPGGKERKHLLQNTLDCTINLMNNARAKHMDIEKIYISAINFDAVNQMTERFIFSITHQGH